MDWLILDLRGDGGNRATHQSGLVDSTTPGSGRAAGGASQERYLFQVSAPRSRLSVDSSPRRSEYGQ